jgi:hypothetical protein
MPPVRSDTDLEAGAGRWGLVAARRGGRFEVGRGGIEILLFESH